MIQDFRFEKNDRGYSDRSFLFMRRAFKPIVKYLFDPCIVNPENMPYTGPCFIYGNHSSYFDPFIVNYGMINEPTAGIMTRDQFSKVIPRILMDSVGIVPTNKYVPEPGIVRKVLKMIDQRRMIVIFPEGGRRWDGRPKPIIESTLKLFWKMKIPIHPVQIHGSYLSWPRWADSFRKGNVELHFLNPISTYDFQDFETFSTHCRELINFNEYYPSERALHRSCSNPAAGIHRLLYRCPETGVNGAFYSPDGEYVFNRESNLRLRMNTASRLLKLDGSEVSILDLLDSINKVPMVFEDPIQKVLLKKNGTIVYSISYERGREKLGRGLAELNSEGLKILVGSQRIYYSLDDIKYTSIEKNYKLTVTGSPEQSFQIDLEGQSAFQWELYIKRLKSGEKPVVSL